MEDGDGVVDGVGWWYGGQNMKRRSDNGIYGDGRWIGIPMVLIGEGRWMGNNSGVDG